MRGRVLVSTVGDEPLHGAFATPAAVLLVLFLQFLAIYGCAALTAGVADKDVSWEQVGPGDDAGRAR